MDGATGWLLQALLTIVTAEWSPSSVGSHTSLHARAKTWMAGIRLDKAGNDDWGRPEVHSTAATPQPY
jgi:hypothetical protein